MVLVFEQVSVWDEDAKKWLRNYPDMPTVRCHFSSISHESAVVVASWWSDRL